MKMSERALATKVCSEQIDKEILEKMLNVITKAYDKISKPKEKKQL